MGRGAGALCWAAAVVVEEEEEEGAKAVRGCGQEVNHAMLPWMEE